MIKILMVSICLLGLGACSPGLEGKLTAQKWVTADGKEDPRFTYFTFAPDNSFVFQGPTQPYTGQWAISESGVELAFNEGEGPSAVVLTLQEDDTLKSTEPKLHFAPWNGEVPARFPRGDDLIGMWKYDGSGRAPFLYIDLAHGGVGKIKIWDRFTNPVMDASWYPDDGDGVEIVLKAANSSRETSITASRAQETHLTVTIKNKRYNYAREGQAP